MDPVLTAANMLYVLAYFVRRTLWLRALSVAGTSCLIVYFLALPEPLMQAVYWNALYVVINAVWIGRLLLQSGLRREAPGDRRETEGERTLPAVRVSGNEQRETSHPFRAN